MNTASKSFKLALATCVISMLAAVISTNSFAGLATPVAVNTITVPGNATVLIGVPYARPVEAFGTVSSLATSGSDTVLTVSVDTAGGSPAIPASVATPSVPGSALSNTDMNVDSFYVCEILDGDAIGLILDVIGGTASTITVKGTIPTSAGISAASITSTTKWALRKAHTLSSLCGVPSATNPFGYGNSATGSSPTFGTVLGQVQILDTTTGALSTYYINKSGQNYKWKKSSGTESYNHAPIGLGKGFLVVNLKAANLTFPVSGDYRAARSRFVATAGAKYLLANPGVTDATFTTSTIALESPNRGTTTPRGTDDEYGIWDTSTKAFKYYKIGGTSTTPSAYDGTNRVSATISKFTSVFVKPGGSGNCILTIAPAPSL